jgi:hypothetical protein
MYAVIGVVYAVKRCEVCAEKSSVVDGCGRLTLRGGLIFPRPLPASEDMFEVWKRGVMGGFGVGVVVNSKRSSFGRERLA